MPSKCVLQFGNPQNICGALTAKQHIAAFSWTTEEDAPHSVFWAPKAWDHTFIWKEVIYLHPFFITEFFTVAAK